MRGLETPDLAALQATHQSYRALLLQPSGPIYADTHRIGHLDLAVAAARADAFLAMAAERGDQLVVTPEYFLPVGSLVKAATGGSFPADGALWVLGCESLTTEILSAFKADCAGHCDVIYEEDPAPAVQGNYFDPVAYCFVTRDTDKTLKRVVLFQFKTAPSRDDHGFENKQLRCGRAIYRFQGKDGYIKLSTIICSDALDLGEDLEANMKLSDRAILIHIQLNPKPKHTDYRRYRNEVFRRSPVATDCDIVCLNWAHNFILSCAVLHADETPVALLDPGAGKTRRAYVWAYARSWHDAVPGVIYEFCPGRGAQYPLAFLAGQDRHGKRWSGTLLTDRYSAYETVVDPRLYPDRLGAACVAHARRNFEELTHDGTSVVGLEAIRRFARIYGIEAELKDLSDDERRAQRQRLAEPLWEELQHWLQLERRLVADGGPTAKAIDYTLGHWAALTRHLDDGAVAIDNNHLERQIKPWAMGRRAWMFVGSELAGQRAAIVMSLVQSARLNGHDPWAYLRDVLQCLPTQRASQIEDLLPHRWQPACDAAP